MFREYTKQQQHQHAVDEEARQEIEKIIGKVLLPSLTFFPSNPGISYELWMMLQHFPYTTRYDLYHKWKSMAYSKYPELIRAKVSVVSDTKKIMR